MSIWGEVELLCRAISEEAGKASERILAEAEDDAARIMAEVEMQASNALDAKMRVQRSDAYAEARRTVDSAELEARKRIMSFREEVIREIFQSLEQRLTEFRKGPKYVQFLLSSIEEGVENLPGSEFVVELNEDDQKLLEGELKNLAVRLNAKMEIKPSTSLNGGVRIYTSDRRLLIDNAFSARLKRMEEEIRQEIWRTIFGADRKAGQ
jgi:vacuolar-type H+-ATPase subunit E/Vma4